METIKSGGSSAFTRTTTRKEPFNWELMPPKLKVELVVLVTRFLNLSSVGMGIYVGAVT